MKARISVIIPFYNTSMLFLQRALDSLANQHCMGIEVLIVNDGSEKPIDEELLIKYSDRFDLRIIDQQHSGVSCARNKGIECATGEYITFLDSDDEFTEGALNEAIKIANDNRADIVIGGCKHIVNNEVVPTNNKGVIIDLSKEDNKELLVHIYGEIKYFHDGIYLGRGISARFIRSSILREIRFRSDLKIGEDTIFTLDVLNHSKRIIVVSSLWYLYHQNINSVTQTSDNSFLPESERFLLTLREYIDNNSLNERMNYCYRVNFQLWQAYVNYISKTSLRERIHLSRYIHKRYPWTELGSGFVLENLSIE